MNDERNDPLWDPTLPPGAELEPMQPLAVFGARARGLDRRMPVFARSRAPRWRRAVAATMVAAAAGVALAAVGLQHRLAWTPGQAWQAQSSGDGANGKRWRVAPGNTVQAGAGEAVTLEVARIGQLVLSPGSRLKLLDTRPRHHRVQLEHGHMRARVWAPPGYFGVESGSAELIDMGCEFEVWKQADGSGRLLVHSGWVEIELGGHEWMVPAGHAVRIDARSASAPLRTNASAQFRQALAALEHSLAREGAQSARAQEAADRLARSAMPADRITLLSLLTRHPALAGSALYPALARGLGAAEGDSAHRQAWIRGDMAAMNAWWKRVPRPPKAWWASWRDALPRS